MKVTKRNGNVVDFDMQKVTRAIERAMSDTNSGLVDKELCSQIGEQLLVELSGMPIPIAVDVIQDTVENLLMDSSRKDAAKQYILYRNDKDARRISKKKNDNRLLTDEFISKYKHMDSPMEQLGDFVFYRTYSRFLPEEKRREYWWETVRRAVEYNCSLVKTNRSEAEELFDNIYNLRQFLSGRTFWVGGTDVAKHYPMSNYNCSFQIVDSLTAFKDLFYLLMIGSGAGLRVLRSDVAKLPKIRTDYEIVHKDYSPLSKFEREDNTSLEFFYNSTAKITIGDSKEGWVQSLDLYLQLVSSNEYRNIKTIIIDYDHVRQKGEKLNTFGGTASGHTSLKNMFTKIDRVFKKAALISDSIKVKLRPIDCMDVANIIGENVVVGGVRRCLPKGSLVHTETGLVKIEDVKIGTKVKTSTGYSDVTDWVYQGKQKLVTIKTQLGDFKCTPKHKMAILTSVGTYEWVMAKDLQQGDRLVFVDGGIDGIETQLPSYTREKLAHDNTSVDITIPQLTEDVAWFFGYMHGNGYVSHNELSFAVPFTYPEYVKKIESVLASFGVNFTTNSVADENCFKIRVKSIQLAEYLGQFKQPNASISIPDFILTGTRSTRTNYLMGLYDSDGTALAKPLIALSSIYPKFLEQTQAVYASLGIASRLFLRREATETCKALYELTVVGEKEKNKFISLIGDNSTKFKNLSKTSRSQNDFGYPSDWFADTKGIKNWDKNSAQMTVSRYEKEFGTEQTLIPIEVFELDYSDEDLYETYDISVDSVHEFVCGSGLLVHNTAEIVLVDADDQECIEAKSKLYELVEGNWVVNEDLLHRQMSNNSIYYREKPTKEKLKWQLERMRYSGEPGWVNEVAGAKRRPNMNGTNPCGEILLDNKGLCNLTTINVLSFVDEKGKLDSQALLKAQRLSARASYRMTCVELELPLWNATQQHDKLLGCSLTGWMDMVNATKMSKSEQIKLLNKLRDAAKKEAEMYAAETNSRVPLLVTTVKPEGTISQLPGVSSGLHYSHSPYYIRRVRINSHDPLVKVCEDLGYPVLPEVGQDWETCTTKVVEFPMKAPEGKTKYDVTAIEQLETYKMFMEHYVDHNASITITVRPHEWEHVEEWVYNNWDDVVALSFLPLEDSFYQLMPYESISEEEYTKRLSEMKPFRPSLLAKYEKEELSLDIGNDGCDTGACPVR